MTETYDAIVIGGGVVGAAAAFNLKALGCGRVLLLERDQTCSGGTATSSGVVSALDPVPEAAALAAQSVAIFERFKETLGTDDADCGWVGCGALTLADAGGADALARAAETLAGRGAEARPVDADAAAALHPWLALDDVAAIVHEPRAGYANARETTFSYVRACLAHDVALKRHRAALGLARHGGRVTGVETYAETFACETVIAAMGPWSANLAAWCGIDLPVAPTRHVVAAFGAGDPYEADHPVVCDRAGGEPIYVRPGHGRGATVGGLDAGEPIESLAELEDAYAAELIAARGRRLARRMPRFADGDFFGTWSGAFDVTPDRNPVLGPVAGLDGLIVACGFSGRGFRLAPALGRVLAQTALGLDADVDLAPFRPARFAEGARLPDPYAAGS